MPQRDIIVIGASAGGVEALSQVVAGLPNNFPAAVLVVLHTSPEGPGLLPALLNRAGTLPAINAEHGTPLLPGRIYVAPVDRHMVLNDGQVHITRGPSENRHRPAIDTLFRSAARAHGERVIGVVLTGYLDDGTAGLLSVKRHGGIAVVQDPEDAYASGMPRSALEQVEVDYRVPLAEIAPLLVRLVAQSESVQAPARKPNEIRSPRASVFTCPECHGTLWEVDDHGMMRYRCRVGHSYSPESMFEDQSNSLDRALWAAVRSLEEHAELSRRLAHRAAQAKHSSLARRYEERARSSHYDATVIRTILENSNRAPASELADALSEPDEESRSA